MGKIIGGDIKPAGDTPPKSRSSARRDLVKLALRNTMGKYGIPSDWMDCRTLSVASPDKKPGMHVLLTVHKADQHVLKYVQAFQENFRREVEGIDLQARQWLFSVSWEFYAKAEKNYSATRREPEDDIASDLQALQAVMSGPAELENGSGAALRDAT